jgi:hypothetical protein
VDETEYKGNEMEESMNRRRREEWDEENERECK